MPKVFICSPDRARTTCKRSAPVWPCIGRQVHLHFTPTYSLWLNQVERWFATIERDLLVRGIFTSVPDLRLKILRCIRKYNDAATAIRWSYIDPSRRIA